MESQENCLPLANESASADLAPSCKQLTVVVGSLTKCELHEAQVSIEKKV